MNKIPLFTLVKHPISFSFRQFLIIFTLACLMGGVTNYPYKNEIYVAFCSGGECDVAVEMAKELVDRHYTNVYVLAEGYPG